MMKRDECLKVLARHITEADIVLPVYSTAFDWIDIRPSPLNYLSHGAMDELRKEQTGKTKVNYSLGYHLRNGMFGHDGAYGTDLSVNPTTGMVAVFMVQCTSGDQWAARDLFLKTATKVFPK